MTDLESLTNRSKTLKANLTRYKTYTTNIEEIIKSNGISDHIKIETALRKNKMEPWLDQFESLQTQIEELDNTMSDQKANEIRDKFESTYYEVLTTLTYYSNNESSSMNKEEGEQSQKTESESQQAQQQLQESSPMMQRQSSMELLQQTMRHKPQLKLPRISLPMFSGQIEQWLNFRDMFNSLIHNRDDIESIEKFQYLKTSLTGDAAALIQAIPLSTTNYSVAWNTIKSRFENTPQIIHNHIKSMFDIESMTKESHVHLQALLNNIVTNINSLKVLGQPTDQWDAIVIYLIRMKLDPVTKREWEKLRSEMKELPTFTDFANFLTKKCQLLETLQMSSKQTNDKSEKQRGSYVGLFKIECKICKAEHPIYKCTRFLNMQPSDRIKEAIKYKLCKNCLRDNHKTKDCKSSKCRKCELQHNTLLHLEQTPSNSPILEEEISQNSSTNNISCSSVCTTQVLLPTARVYVLDKNGCEREARILLDSGSQSNFIQREFFQTLGLKSRTSTITITGINNSQSKALGVVTITLKSKINSFQRRISCFLLDKITNNIPQSTIDLNDFIIPKTIQLADSTFSEIGRIDILLGVEHFWSILCAEQISLGKNAPILQKTLFGWIISGTLSRKTTLNNNFCFTLNDDSYSEVQRQLAKMWEIQEIPDEKSLLQKEHACELLFEKTTVRNTEGRFVVRLPFHDNISNLGESYNIAKKRFYNVERRLLSDPSLHMQYSEVLNEYIRLNHMSLINYDEKQLKKACFLPHHAVVRPDRLTTKVRVVFDASCKSDSGLSLNDTLMVGPVVQSDLFTILLQFRLHPIAATSDCEKMYRQIIMDPRDRIFQNIIWRENRNSEIKTYQLNTVSFGTASAPYLATRCIKQIAIENEKEYPEACKYIQESMYVDDFIASFKSLESGTKMVSQINDILLKYGFPMKKWASNEPQILKELSQGETSINLNNESNSCKTLGMMWETINDNLHFPSSLQSVVKLKITKRTILSIISSIFDPLGLIGPIIVKSKIILQRLWQLNLSWDESVPMELHTMWTSYYEELLKISNIVISRQVLCKNPTIVQLHAFSDASEVAYGVCIYLRSTNSENQHITKLLCSKGRVTPLKTITIPRLELMAAHLSSKLVAKINLSLQIETKQIYYWTDSSIVLGWLKKPPSQLKTFVSHRVADIVIKTETQNWRHVRSADNPADLLSRGVSVMILEQSKLWWHGPLWLTMDISSWPVTNNYITQSDLPELKTMSKVLTSITKSTNSSEIIENLICKYSKLTKLQRVIAFILRFKNNVKKHDSQLYGPLSVEEIHSAWKMLIKHVQQESFTEELKSLLSNRKISIRNHLAPLNPFIDDQGILRVGGRIRHSNMPYDSKFPVILPKIHSFTTLVIWHYHCLNLHAGTELTLSASRQLYWIIHGKQAVRKITTSCIKCRRFNAKPSNPIMGDLPQDRIVPSRPFATCGTDFAGPFLMRSAIGRGSKTTKSYLCIFICFLTKAVHLEIVGNLSADAFIACLKRFISRRGLCKTIYSDNGTNYVGASHQLKELYEFLSQSVQTNEISDFLSNRGIIWKFMPARSPNFGGLWESAIKSAKRHLNKITMNHSFTYEELNTLFCQIESVMNSRPLTPIPSESNDYQILTPGHFLIGDYLQCIPEPNLLEAKQTRLKRFEMVQQLHQLFWKAWSHDYLNLLQCRPKCSQSTICPLKEGSIVLLKEATPPLLWRMARVIKLHPGPDTVVRVATVKTSFGEVKRCVTKLVPLLLEKDSV